MDKQNKVNKAIYPVVFDLNLIIIPLYQQVLRELMDATQDFREEGSVSVPLEAMNLAEMLEMMDAEESGLSSYSDPFSFFRHMQIMIDVGYHGQSSSIFHTRNLRLYMKDMCRLGVERTG